MASPGETTGPSGAQAADGSWAAHATRLSEEARDKAADILEPAQHKVREAAERQRAAGAERVDAVAKAVHEAADRIGAELPPQAAQYLHDAADRLDRVSANLRNASVDDLIGTVSDFARRRPAAFFGGAVLAGFVLSRFLVSSSDRDTSMSAPAEEADSGTSAMHKAGAFGDPGSAEAIREQPVPGSHAGGTAGQRDGSVQAAGIEGDRSRWEQWGDSTGD